MRLLRLLVAVPLLLVAPSEATAQRGRFAFIPFVGYAMGGDLYEHDITSTASHGEVAAHVEVIEVEAAPRVGAVVEYSLTRRWSLWVEGSYGRADYRYLDSLSAELPGREPPLRSSQVTMLRPAGTTLGVSAGVDRRFVLTEGLPDELRVGLAASLPHFRMEEMRSPPCEPSPWDPCFDLYERFAGSYDEWYHVPSLAASAAVRHHFDGLRGLGIELRGTYSLGRTRAGRVGDDDVAVPAQYPVRPLVGNAGATVGVVWRP